MIKVSGLSHKRSKQSDPRISCLMFQKIYIMYHETNNKEENNSAVLLTSMSDHKQATTENKKLEDSRDNTKKSTFPEKY